MCRESRTCVGKQSGKPLREYDSSAEAERAAEYVAATYGNEVVPYRCSRCGHWHLSPKTRHTPSTTCRWCTGHDGRPKATYRTEREAERRASILGSEKRISLRVYECPQREGWHLTSSW